jgi:hypothetical protein
MQTRSPRDAGTGLSHNGAPVGRGVHLWRPEHPVVPQRPRPPGFHRLGAIGVDALRGANAVPCAQ